MSESIKLYGDARLATATGHGVDIASQRADDLDLKAITFIETLSVAGPRPLALDLGCGFGGQAIRMAKAGAHVLAMDAEDYSVVVTEAAAIEHVSECVEFIRSSVETRPALPPCAAIVCQRMIHYLPHDQGMEALRWMFSVASESSRLFISASGLGSELGHEYLAAQLPVQERFATLAPEMAAKHSIRPKVCLYRLHELIDAVESAGWRVKEAFLSPFGNVKVVAAKEPGV